MNRAVHAHLRSILPPDPGPDDPVFLGGGARPNARFQALCALAGVRPRTTGPGTGRSGGPRRPEGSSPGWQLNAHGRDGPLAAGRSVFGGRRPPIRNFDLPVRGLAHICTVGQE